MKNLLIAVIAATCMTGCTTTTVTAKDGTTTKTTVPVVALWEHGFDLADSALKSKKAAVAAPTKGE